MEKTMPHDASESLVPGLANGAVIGKEPICFETILSNFPILQPESHDLFIGPLAKVLPALFGQPIRILDGYSAGNWELILALGFNRARSWL
jgi:hypothetical protein